MTSDRTEEVLDQLAAIRRRIDELRNEWDAHRDTANAIRGLNELAASSDAYPSIQALLLGASQLIKRGEAAGHRLEKLSDHLHGYMVGWEDAAKGRLLISGRTSCWLDLCQAPSAWSFRTVGFAYLRDSGDGLNATSGRCGPALA